MSCSRERSLRPSTRVWTELNAAPPSRVEPPSGGSVGRAGPRPSRPSSASRTGFSMKVSTGRSWPMSEATTLSRTSVCTLKPESMSDGDVVRRAVGLEGAGEDHALLVVVHHHVQDHQIGALLDYAGVGLLAVAGRSHGVAARREEGLQDATRSRSSSTTSIMLLVHRYSLKLACVALNVWARSVSLVSTAQEGELLQLGRDIHGFDEAVRRRADHLGYEVHEPAHSGGRGSIDHRLQAFGLRGQDEYADVGLGDDALQILQGVAAAPGEHASDLLGIGVKGGRYTKTSLFETPIREKGSAEVADAHQRDVLHFVCADDAADGVRHLLDVVASGDVAEAAEAGQVAPQLSRGDSHQRSQAVRVDEADVPRGPSSSRARR